MTLDNLLGIGRLKEHKVSRAEVARLLVSANARRGQRNLSPMYVPG